MFGFGLCLCSCAGSDVAHDCDSVVCASVDWLGEAEGVVSDDDLVGGFADDHHQMSVLVSLGKSCRLGSCHYPRHHLLQVVNLRQFWVSIDSGDLFGQEHDQHVGGTITHCF